MHLLYAGRVVRTDYQELQGKVAIQPIVEMIEDESLMPGFAPLRKQQIQHWKLYNALGLNQQTAVVSGVESLTFIDWLSEQLQTLGVESVEDIELFEADDLPFAGIHQKTTKS